MRFKTDTGKYAALYPQERPNIGTPIKVWNKSGKYLGAGVASYHPKCGIVISVGGRTYDSTNTIHWLPLEI